MVPDSRCQRTGSSTDRLVQGQTLTIPGQINSYNNSEVFKSYNPAELIGSTTPGIPYVAPPQDAGCNLIATVVMVVIAVVVTAYLGPQFAAYFNSQFLGYAAAGAVASTEKGPSHLFHN